MDETDEAPPRQQVAAGAPRAASNVGRDLAREIEQVVVDEEKAAELVKLDELQFFREPADGLGMIERAWGIAFLHPRVAQLGQRLRCGRAIGTPEVGEGVAQVARQIEGLAALGNGQSRSDSIQTVMKQRHDFFQWPQVKLAVRISHPVRAVECRAVANRDHDVVQAMKGAGVVVDVTRRYDAKLYVACETMQCRGMRQFSAHPISLDLHEKPVRSEHRSAPLREFAGSAQSIVLQSPRQHAVTARP